MVLTPSLTSMRFVLLQTGSTCDTHHFHVIATRLHVRCHESTKRLRRIVDLHLEKWNVKSTSFSREKHTLHFRFYWLTHSDNRKKRSFILKMNTSMTTFFFTMRGIPLTKSLKKLFLGGEWQTTQALYTLMWDSSIFLVVPAIFYSTMYFVGICTDFQDCKQYDIR